MGQRRPTVALLDRPRPIWEEKGNVRVFKTTKIHVDVPNVLTSMRLILVYDFCLWLFVFCLLSAIFVVFYTISSLAVAAVVKRDGDGGGGGDVKEKAKCFDCLWLTVPPRIASPRLASPRLDSPNVMVQKQH